MRSSVISTTEPLLLSPQANRKVLHHCKSFFKTSLLLTVLFMRFAGNFSYMSDLSAN